MATIHSLGHPRIGAQRELKYALESYWQGETDRGDLQQTASDLRQSHWRQQSALDLVPVGDFSLYDQVLDMSETLGNLPQRAEAGSGLDHYFRAARGQSTGCGSLSCNAAAEMTKWFDTNYHYLVPELEANTQFKLNPDRLLDQLAESRTQKLSPKPVIIGPVTYLYLGKSKDSSDRLALLDRLLPVYRELLIKLARQGAEWVQIDEPALVTDLGREWHAAFKKAYHYLANSGPKKLLTTYFGALGDNLDLAASLPVEGIHLDCISSDFRGRKEVQPLIKALPQDRVVSLGVINGRNIWKTDLTEALDWLAPISAQLGNRLWLAPSCSLLHTPYSLAQEEKLSPEIKSWLAFATEKLDELRILRQALVEGLQSVASEITANAEALHSRKRSPRVTNPTVQNTVEGITPSLGERTSAYPQRAKVQREKFKLPLFPTTTIGSFPQTPEIRQCRSRFKRGELSKSLYRLQMQQEIAYCVKEQENLGLDVLVHGEAERNDMVEYFGEQLDGFAFSQFGWVQSYGSRCVKPPILYGDVQRTRPMTVEWTQYAQSLTNKPVKGMLTGPVTILNWSFVRDDQPLEKSCYQLALAIREEVLDLEKAGVGIIQIDEAALREGLPLRQSEWQAYLNWAVESFRVCANGVRNDTQIHTHMCYSEFNDIIDSIAHMDADVITIETSRSDMELLDVFDDYKYPNEIGPGVYDIHSPNIPSTDEVVSLIQKASEKLPGERLWINPDCGLKTRRWEEVRPALQNLVKAADRLREKEIVV